MTSTATNSQTLASNPINPKGRPASLTNGAEIFMAIYIVFSPEGPTPPVVVHQSHKEALGVAYRMANAHRGQSFHVMKSCSKAIAKSGDQKEELAA